MAFSTSHPPLKGYLAKRMRASAKSITVDPPDFADLLVTGPDWMESHGYVVRIDDEIIVIRPGGEIVRPTPARRANHQKGATVWLAGIINLEGIDD